MLRKKAILLIHGFAGGAYDYGNLPNDLEFVNNYKVFTYTLPGHDKAIINKVTKDDWIKMSEMQIEKIIKHGYKEIYVKNKRTAARQNRHTNRNAAAHIRRAYKR